MDMFGEQAAKETLDGVNKGKSRASTIERYIFSGENTKGNYANRLRKE